MAGESVTAFEPRIFMDVQDFIDLSAATDYYIILKAVQAGTDLQISAGVTPANGTDATYPPASIEVIPGLL
jgi:hypothetical protein